MTQPPARAISCRVTVEWLSRLTQCVISYFQMDSRAPNTLRVVFPPPPSMDSPAPPASLVNLMPPLLAQDFSGHCAHENALSTRKSKEDSDPITRVRKNVRSNGGSAARVLSTPSPEPGPFFRPPPCSSRREGRSPTHVCFTLIYYPTTPFSVACNGRLYISEWSCLPRRA